MARPATAAVRLLTGEREPVRLATTANIDVDAGGLLTIDGIQTAVGDRILVKDQTDGSENGIRTVSTGQWYRAADARTARTMQKGTTVHVQEGTANAGKTFVFNTLDPQIGDDDITIVFYQSDDTIGAVNTAISNGLTSIGAAGDAAVEAVQEAGADVTAIKAGDTDASGFGFVLDEDDMASDSDTKVPTQQSSKAYNDKRFAATRTALKALAGGLYTAVYLFEAGREGWFKWRSSDLSAYVTADTLEGIYIAPTSDATGASGAWVRAYSGAVNVKWFGAAGDGTTDDTTAFNGAIVLLKLLGGGVIFVPACTYIVSNSNPGAVSSFDRYAILFGDGSDDIQLLGAPGSKIKLADSADATVIQLGLLEAPYASVHGVKINGVEIDGNRANQTAPEASTKHWSGIMACNDCTGITIEDCNIHDCQYYGIGFQSDANNADLLGFHNCHVRNVLIEDTGADGMDCKDFQLNSSGNTIDGLTVRRYGLGNADSVLLSGQAGLDLRSGWSATNILIEEPGTIPDQVGIRTQISSEYSDSTVPKQPTRLSDFTIHGSDIASSYGLRMDGIYSTADHGLVDHCGDAVRISNQHITVSKVTGMLCVNGGVAFGDGGSVASLSSFEGCLFRDNTGSGILLDDSADIDVLETHVRSNGVGWTVTADALNPKIIGGSNAGNTTPATLNGTVPYIQNVSGFRTKKTYTTTGAIDSTGSQDITFAHGLPFTPRLQDCMATFRQSSAVTDWAPAFLEILSVDATNVVVRYRVQTASATVGALTGINLLIDAFNGV